MDLALLDRTRLNKVPQVALLFWIPKILSTAVDETGADYLAVHVGLGVLMTDGIMLLALAAALAMRLRQGSRQQVWAAQASRRVGASVEAETHHPWLPTFPLPPVWQTVQPT